VAHEVVDDLFELARDIFVQDISGANIGESFTGVS
jgi:hypothetical protein